MLNYYRPIQDANGFTYSCDMIRLNFSVYSKDFEKFKKLIDLFQLKPGCDARYFPSHKSVGYKHMWNFTIETSDGQKGSFAMGLQLNDKIENYNCGFIEFNPNKLMHLNEFYSFFSQLRQFCSLIEVIRYDLAIDVPLPRERVKMVRTRNSSYEYLVEENKAEKERLCFK